MATGNHHSDHSLLQFFFTRNIILKFLVPADEVTVVGPTEVKIDHMYVYRCEAKNANPPPEIQWIVNGILTTAGVTTQIHPPPPRPSGYVSIHHPTGWRVTSDFNLDIMEEDSKIAITCNAVSHGHHGDTMISKAEKMLTVLSK